MINSLLLLLASFCTFVSAYNPGAVASIDIRIVEANKLWISNFIIKKLNTVKVPDITVGDVESGLNGWMNDNSYFINGVPTVDDVTVFVVPEDNAIKFRIDNLMARFKSLNTSINDGTVEGQGELYADLYSWQAYVGITFDVQPSIHGGNLTNF
jgi:hypothetical protein